MRRKIVWVLCLIGCGAPSGHGTAAARADTAAAVSDARPTVLFLGTSLTAGLGLAEDEAYPALIQRKIDSAGLGYRVVNAGVSGETSAGGRRRLGWLLRQPVDVLVLELGANDALRGQNLDTLRANLRAIIDSTRTVYPDAAVVVAGMQAPPNLGPRYTARFRAVFPALAKAEHTALIPFLLAKVAAVPHLNQADGIHPTAEGARIVADNVWHVLEPILRRRAAARGREHAAAGRGTP